MEFKYCPNCGKMAVKREIGDEGIMPYCEICEKPLFDMFSSCVIALVVNEYEEAALLRQNYISTQYDNLVSGYMKPGESAEEAITREIKEEIGIDINSLEIVGTYWFDKKDVLMIGFFATAQKKELVLSSEVDFARWVSVNESIHMVHPKGSVSYALLAKYLKKKFCMS